MVGMILLCLAQVGTSIDLKASSGDSEEIFTSRDDTTQGGLGFWEGLACISKCYGRGAPYIFVSIYLGQLFPFFAFLI